jgi:hypothetical protein
MGQAHGHRNWTSPCARLRGHATELRTVSPVMRRIPARRHPIQVQILGSCVPSITPTGGQDGRQRSLPNKADSSGWRVSRLRKAFNPFLVKEVFSCFAGPFCF